jgi:multidrug resistance protein
MSTTTTNKNYAMSWIILLASLTALGPLSIDMYLSALPQMADDFGVTTQQVANSLPAYFLGLAIGQLVYGPVSDRIGRKPPLYFGLALYVVASLLCVFAQNEWSLIAARVLQALGGCVGVVIARAAIRDRLDMHSAAQAFASMMIVSTIAPILAPSMGAWVLLVFEWNMIFVLLMLYLKRRKQKKLTLAARQGATAIDIDPNAKPWLIAYATQTGVSEQLAWRTATALQQAHQPATVKSVQQLTLADLQQAEQVLFIASTYGTGEAPDLASSFEKKIMSGQADLSHLHYAVLALGSKEYPDTFCSFGHRIDQWLKNNGAQQLFATIEVDNASNEHIQQWNAALAQSTQLELQAMDIDKTFDDWTLVKREVLNPGSLGAPAFNLEFKPEHEAQWQAGDIAEIQPGNSAERIAQFLAAHQIPAGTVVASMQQRIEDILWNRDLTQPIFPFISSEELLNQLPVLPTREYSIASIPSQQILRLVVRQQKDTSGEIGLGSGWLTQYAALNAPVQQLRLLLA